MTRFEEGKKSVVPMRNIFVFCPFYFYGFLVELVRVECVRCAWLLA
jgi:hypothetical protein